MSRQSPSSKYFLTKDKKLEIQEHQNVFRARIPVRFHLNPLEMLMNLFYALVKSKKRLRSYSVRDQKDQKMKKIYLTHTEIQQVWNHPLNESSPRGSMIKKNVMKQKK